jgi:hypothetical protein
LKIMLGIHELWLFVVSGLLLNISPGPDTAYVVGRSLQIGWPAAPPRRSASAPAAWCTSSARRSGCRRY